MYLPVLLSPSHLLYTIGDRTSEGDVRLISEENVRQGPARVSANIIFGFGHRKWTPLDT